MESFNRPRKQRRFMPEVPSRYQLLKWLLIGLVTATCSLLLFAIWVSDGIPSFEEREKTDSNLATEIYSRNNVLIGKIFDENRKKVTYDQLPKHLVDALISTEDARFYEHSGIDLFGLIRAVTKSIIYKLTFGKFSRREGASTITMQAAGNLFVGREVNVSRKVQEMMTSLLLERYYSKKEIIQMYFNVVFYGHNSHGIASASRTYFDKDVEELDLLESATLVGLLKAPSTYNPISHPQRAQQRRNIVLERMISTNKLSKLAYDTLKTQPVLVHRPEKSETRFARYFNNQVERELNSLSEKYQFNPKTDGLKVYTTLDTTFQVAMDSSITKYIDQIQETSMATKETKRIRRAYLLDSTYVSEAQADSAFKANHVVQYGFIVIDQKTGSVLGHLGGRPSTNYFYDHVFQGTRHPGSTTKPFVYATAIEQGYTPAHQLRDEPYVQFLGDKKDDEEYIVSNWNHKYKNDDVTLRYGLSNSMNTIALRVMNELIGSPRPVIRLMNDMGITEAKLPPVPSLPLGTFDITPFEMVSAYTAFANGGVRVEPHTITHIVDKFGNTIYEVNPVPKEVLNKNTAFIVTSMLKSTVNEGTAASMRWKYGAPYKAHIAAKTGTTSQNRDAWTISYTPRFTAGIWVGIDYNPPKGHKYIHHNVNVYSSAVVPVMGEFMKRIYKAHPEWEFLEFEQPDGVVELTVCGSHTGLQDDEIQLANTSCPNKITDFFRVDFAPTVHCEIHTGNVKLQKSSRRKRY